MGVFCDYFRASDADYAMLAIVSGPQNTDFNTVEAKGVDPFVMLGKLVAFIRSTPWSPNTVAARTIWPPPKTKPTSQGAFDRLSQNSPWRTGPWLEELSVQTRDTLALADDARLPELAEQWAKIEEFGRLVDARDLLPLIRELVDLARKARDNGEQLYCWSML
jgi:hypothetical protein